MSTPTITVIGSLNTDLITRTNRFPNPGETLTANSFSTGSGGKGANQAVACARLSRSTPSSLNATRSQSTSTGPSLLPIGLSASSHTPNAEPSVHVRMVGAVGDDEFGTRLKDGLESNGIHTGDVRVIEGETTGTAVVIVEEATGENRILITPGANAHVVPSTLPDSLFTPPLPSLLILQLEIPILTVIHIITTARQKGIPVLLNPAPAVELPKEVYAGLEHLVLNQTEAQTLAAGIEISSTRDNDDGRLHDICTHFHRLGVQNVILTLGGEGVYWRSSTASEGTQRRVPAERVEKVVDTTAAGDTFVGAYAVGVATGQGVGRAVLWANKAAARTVEEEGAQHAIPWRDDVSLPKWWQMRMSG
ncbi:MAG: hypothetical protein Q9184_002972 [Pyrenodesmia sp. 2 TL-2023]